MSLQLVFQYNDTVLPVDKSLGLATALYLWYPLYHKGDLSLSIYIDTQEILFINGFI